MLTYTPAAAKKLSPDMRMYDILANEQAGAIFSSIPALKALPENLLYYTFGEFLVFVQNMFPQFAAASNALAAAVMNVNREQG